ncbi:MAG: hypothetical protein U0X20_17085 [Caldilineaceae bacterium]
MTSNTSTAAPAETPAKVPSNAAIVLQAFTASDEWMKEKPPVLSIPADATIVKGNYWSTELPSPLRWTDIADGDNINILGRFGVDRENHIYIEDSTTHWTLQLDVRQLVTDVLKGAETYYNQALYARAARLWIEAHTPEPDDDDKAMFDAAKLIETCHIEDALKKYNMMGIVRLLELGQMLIEGRFDEDGKLISPEEKAATEAQEQADLEAQEAPQEQA